MKENRSKDKSKEKTYDLGLQKFYHGTKANLKPGDLIEPSLILTTVRGTRRPLSI